LYATADFPAACIGEAMLTISGGRGVPSRAPVADNHRSYNLLTMHVTERCSVLPRGQADGRRAYRLPFRERRQAALQQGE